MQSWTIVSAAGVFLCGWLPSLIAPVYPLIGALIIAGFGLRTGKPILYLCALSLIGAAYGTLWGEVLLERRLPPTLESVALPARITVLEPPQIRRFAGGGRRQRFAADVRLETCPVEDPDCNRDIGRVLLAWYGDESLRAGEQWRADIKLRRPHGLANPGSFNFEAWLSRNRFAATGHISRGGLERLAEGQTGPHQRWRQLLAERLRNHPMDHRIRGVLLAMTNGDRSGIDHELWQRFQVYGLNHLLVISGLHVGLVAAMGFLAGRLVGRRCAHLTAAGLALIYSALAGFALPTLRALAMLASVQMAALAGRRVRAWHSLGLALALVALVDPLATHSAGFWLSFGAVALIFTVRNLYPEWSAWRLTLRLQLMLSLGMGLVASYWFGGLGWFAPAANLIAVPVLTFWLAPLCLAGALLAHPLPAVAGWCWDLAALPVAGFLRVDALLSAVELPLWVAYQPTLPALLSTLAGCVLLLTRRGWPQRWLAGLFLAAALFPTRSPPAADTLEFWLLDVGQGLAAVVLQGDTVLVYDTGAGDPAGPNMASSVIAPFLSRRGIEHIDVLVISHGDQDHASGVFSLHRRFDVGETWVGELPFPGLLGQRACRAGTSLRRGDVRLELLSPAGDGGEGNNRSCVLRLDFRGVRLLLPGDIEVNVEHALLRRRRGALAAEVLVVPHHGSRSSSSSAFIAAVRPQVALLSRGYRNRFGHPHPQVVARYRHFGIPLCDTAELGALKLVIDDEGVRAITGWRRERRFYWQAAASTACVPAYNG